LAARFYGIPIIVHESDSVPGRANAIIGKFAHRIAISYPQAAEHFKGKNTALTGNPVRDVIKQAPTIDPVAFFKLDPQLPTIFVVGGSQGAERINDMLLSALPQILEKYQVIHQVGEKHIESYIPTVDVALESSKFRDRYRPIGYLTGEQMRAAGALSTVIVSRGGSTIFEIALWGKPSVIIPITESNGDHQRQNAFAYARAGACEVIDESNLSPNLFLTEIDRLLGDPDRLSTMSQNALEFSRPDAAKKIAAEMMHVIRDHYGA
jgi:UDP-N-acetylglucosamine--N-acetylmuramyl-(pentapeptide) pyrophosphoryl-undecaprenol N-acetylglucosamine transferase